jgi:hypothetical protein
MASKLLILTLSLAFGLQSAFSAEPQKPDCAPFALPDLKLTWVAPDIVHNGMPMQIRRFDSSEDVPTILARYRREWKASAQSPQDAIEYAIGGYQVIAKMRDKCFYTVQVRRQGLSGSQGLLAVSQIQDNNQVRVLGKDFPMMSGSLVAADMTHRDPGKEARTIMLMNQFSTHANADFYRRVLGGDGWNTLSDHLVPFQGGNGNGYALTFKRGFNETSMVISRTEGGSSVLVNQVDKP